MNHYDTTPEGCAARTERIQAANQAHEARMRALATCRALYRAHGVKGPWELLEALQSIHASASGDTITQEFMERLSELIADFDAELNSTGPELMEVGFDRRGELDCFTVGVKGRA